MEKMNFLADLADILEVDREDLADDYVLDNRGEWNSLAIVATIALIDEQFNMIIPGDTLRECFSVKQLWEVIQNGREINTRDNMAAPQLRIRASS